MLIAFPPCTYMTNASAVRMRVKGEIQPERYAKAMEAKEFFIKFYNADCPRICIENPTPMKLIGLPPYTQAIQPWQFGHPLYQKDLPMVEGTAPSGTDRHNHRGNHALCERRIQGCPRKLQAVPRAQRA